MIRMESTIQYSELESWCHLKALILYSTFWTSSNIVYICLVIIFILVFRWRSLAEVGSWSGQPQLFTQPAEPWEDREHYAVASDHILEWRWRIRIVEGGLLLQFVFRWQGSASGVWPERKIRWTEVPSPVRVGGTADGGWSALLRQVNVLVQVAVSKIRMVQVPRDKARRVLRMRWSRKPEVTDFKADRRVVWQCVQVKNSSDYFWPLPMYLQLHCIITYYHPCQVACIHVLQQPTLTGTG